MHAQPRQPLGKTLARIAAILARPNFARKVVYAVGSSFCNNPITPQPGTKDIHESNLRQNPWSFARQTEIRHSPSKIAIRPTIRWGIPQLPAHTRRKITLPRTEFGQFRPQIIDRPTTRFLQ
jgi:hypothetical protein